MIGIPLAHIEVLIIVHTDVMAMLKNGRIRLQSGLQDAVLVSRRGAARIGDHFILPVQDGNEPGIIIESITGRIFRPADARIEIGAIEYGPANIHTGHIYAPDELSVHREDLEAVLFAGSADKGRVVLIPEIDGDAVGVHQIVFLIRIMMSPEMADILSLTVILKDIIGTVAIRHIDIAIGRYGRLRRLEIFVVLIDADRAGMTDGEDQLTVQGRLYYLPCLTVSVAHSILGPAAIRQQEEIFAPFLRDRKTMTAGKCVAPIIQQLARLIENEDVVHGVVPEHDKPALAILHHFMAIGKGMAVHADLRPACIDLVSVLPVTDHQFFWLLVFVQDGKAKARFGHQEAGGYG